VVFGSARETMTGLLRAVAAGRPGPAKALAIAQTLPKASGSVLPQILAAAPGKRGPRQDGSIGDRPVV
jgi:hypothetical protein